MGVPIVKPSAERETICEASAAHARLAQEVGEGGADPPRVADVRPADLVRHARERDVAFDHRPSEELVVVERHLALDHPVEVERPSGRVDRGHEQRGVDPVEVRVRREERGDAGDVDADSVRERREGVGRFRDRGGLPRRRGVRPAGEQPAQAAGDRGDPDGCRPGAQESAAVEAADRGIGSGRRGVGTFRHVPQPPERQDPGERTSDRRDRVGEVVRRPGHGGGHADRPQDHRRDDAEARPPR